MRAILPFIVTMLSVCIIAPVVGTALFGALTGTPHLVISRDLAGVPFLFYGFRYSLPIVLLAAFGASVAATVFAYIFGRRKPYSIWAIAFACFGIVLGLFCAAPRIIACLEEREPGLAAGWFFGSSIFGLLGMLALSFIWFRFFRPT